ncbi:conserved hypothetical protein [Candida dubliniensis CD36]|uniref:RNase MRP protein 1 RNA binding domain-containing protein n=1 Tax=Candida dubliniensis (strain CD36 / ATCC MYA-646 / CBS 7987 / NCPF 3949 / NRRL Y-17841) TaxID=573826 RepID=B9W9V8_CANDC|nr:conserved hypothetical protein [Candida dubliniensis CD36]CAX45596.1 conserved hypothetical protein [Candida dubliniensis CD36]
MDKSTFKQLTNEYDILYLLYHRSKNQHHQQIWFKYLNIMIRNLRKILKLQIDINRLSIIKNQNKIDYKTKQIIQISNKILKLIKSSYWNYNSILVLGQYITLGLGLIGSLSKISYLIINGIKGVNKHGIDKVLNKMQKDTATTTTNNNYQGSSNVGGSKDLMINNQNVVGVDDEIDFGEIIPYNEEDEEEEEGSISGDDNERINENNTQKGNLLKFDQIDTNAQIKTYKSHSNNSKHNLSNLEEEENSNINPQKSQSNITNQSTINSTKNVSNNSNESTLTNTKKRKLNDTSNNTTDDIFGSTKNGSGDNKKLKKKDKSLKPLKKKKKKKKSAIDDIFG